MGGSVDLHQATEEFVQTGGIERPFTFENESSDFIVVMRMMVVMGLAVMAMRRMIAIVAAVIVPMFLGCKEIEVDL